MSGWRLVLAPQRYTLLAELSEDDHTVDRKQHYTSLLGTLCNKSLFQLFVSYACLALTHLARYLLHLLRLLCPACLSDGCERDLLSSG